MEITPGFEDMYGGIRRSLAPSIYAIAESRPYRFWDEFDLKPRGSKKKFEELQDLKAACCQWVVWMEQHPLYAEKAFHFQGSIVTHDEPRKRVLTKAALLDFLNASPPSWDVRWPSRGDEWQELRHRVEVWIYRDKFEGVNAGFYNSAVIASDLGLTSRVAAELSGGGSPIKIQTVREMSVEELQAALSEKGLPTDLLDSFIGSDGTESDPPAQGSYPEDFEAGDS